MEYTLPILCLLGVILVAWGSPLNSDTNDDLVDISNPFSTRQRRAAKSCYGTKCGNQRNTGTSYSSNRRNTGTSYSTNQRNTGTNYGSNQNNRCNTPNCRYARPASASSFSSASGSSYSQGNAYSSAASSAGTFNPAAFFNAISGRNGCYNGNCLGSNNFGYIPPEFFTGQGYFGNFPIPPGFNFPIFPPNNGFGTGGFYFPQVPQFSLPRPCTGYGCSGRSVSVTSRVRGRPGSQGKGVWAGSSISTQNGKVTSYRAGTGRL